MKSLSDRLSLFLLGARGGTITTKLTWQTSKAKIISVFPFCKYRTQLAGMQSRNFDRSCVFREGAAEKSCLTGWRCPVNFWMPKQRIFFFFPCWSQYLLLETTDRKCCRNSSISILPMETSTLHVWEWEPVTSMLPIKTADIIDVLSFDWTTVPIGK